MVFISAAVLTAIGCQGLQKPGDFVESLRNPTTFPEIHQPEIKHIDEIASEYSLTEDENIKVVPLGKDISSSLYLLLIGGNAEMDAHNHKSHDEIIYFKKGSGILELDGTRHTVKEGMIVVIPRLSVHKYINTGEGTSVAVSIFSPPFDGEDIKEFRETAGIKKKKKKSMHDKAMKKSVRELKKEKGEDVSLFGLWGKDEEETVSAPGEEWKGGGEVEEEQKILELTEEGRQKIREARQKVKEKEKVIIGRIIQDEKLKALQSLRDDGLISQKEFEAKKAELINNPEE